MPRHASHTPAAQILLRGHRPRHATGHLADATDELSRPPDDLEDATGRSENAPDGLENAPGQSSRHPGRLSRSPGELENAPTRPERVPSEPEGSGAARRKGMVARRSPVAARREGIDGARERGFCALARAVLVPEGRRAVATGGASRSDAEPVDGTRGVVCCPEGAEGSNDRVMNWNSSAPAGAGFGHDTRSTGCAGEAPAPPVATTLGPDGAGSRGQARAMFNTARAGFVHAFSGEVPEGRPPHTPLWYQHAHPPRGGEVRRG